jgi:hypothetical protein
LNWPAGLLLIFFFVILKVYSHEIHYLVLLDKYEVPTVVEPDQVMFHFNEALNCYYVYSYISSASLRITILYPPRINVIMRESQILDKESTRVMVVLRGITSSWTRNPPEEWLFSGESPAPGQGIHQRNGCSAGNYQLLDKESIG